MSYLLNNCNTANYNNSASWNALTGNITTVGSNGKSSYYGTYDQSGNINELLDTISNGYPIFRGGSFGGNEDSIKKTLVDINFFDAKRSDLGFRIAKTATDIDSQNYVLINNANNTSDVSSNLGSVSYNYQIKKYLVTNSEYAEFLNAIAVSSNDLSLWVSQMGDTLQRGGITRSGSSGSYVYSVISNMGNKPVNFVNWFCIARYVNWLSNGKQQGIPSNTTTETGVYSLLNFINQGTKPTRNNTNSYWIPNENEWYKSAYYDPNKNGSGEGYWLYATMSDSLPTPVTADAISGDANGPTNLGCVTPTPTPTITATPSNTVTPSVSITRTPTSTITVTPTRTPTTTITASNTVTPSITKSRTPSATQSPTPTTTPTISLTSSITPTVTPTKTRTSTPTQTPTPTVTPSKSLCNSIAIGQLIYQSNIFLNDTVQTLYKGILFDGKLIPNAVLLTQSNSLTTTDLPATAPRDFTATNITIGGYSYVRLSWKSPDNLNILSIKNGPYTYRIDSNVPGMEDEGILGTGIDLAYTTAMTLPNYNDSLIFTIKVCDVDLGNCGDSASVNISAPMLNIGDPISVPIVSLTSDSTTFTLSWTTPALNGSILDGYDVRCPSLNYSDSFNANSATFTYSQFNMLFGQTYTFYVSACRLNNNNNQICDGAVASIQVARSSNTPTPTKTTTPTVTPTPSVTRTNTMTPSVTSTSTATLTPTNTVSTSATPTPSVEQTNTPTPSVTQTNTPTNTQTLTSTQTNTPTPSISPTNTITPSVTPTSTITPTPTNNIVSSSAVSLGYNSNKSMNSVDSGSSWSLGDLTDTALWTTVCFGNGTHIAAAYNEYIINYSNDNGSNWSSYDTTNDLVGFNPLWIASAFDSINNAFILTANSNSKIAIIKFLTGNVSTVSYSSLPATANWKCVAYGDGQLIAVPENSSNYAVSVDGGVSWTQRSLPVSKTWKVLEYLNNQFLLVDGVYGSDGLLLTSSDGINWTTTTISGGQYNSISYGNGVYLLGSSGSAVLRSVNATSWSSTTIPIYYPNSLLIAYKNNFIIIGAGVSQSLTSSDGISWTIRSGYNYTWFDIA